MEIVLHFKFCDTLTLKCLGSMTCKYKNCSKTPIARGLCTTHYHRWWRHGDPSYSKFDGRSQKFKDIYNIYIGMLGRCNNPYSSSYKYYGGRGISVCEAWKNDFYRFLTDIGTRPSLSHSIDRIDVNGNYEPSNVRWATTYEQARNKRLSNLNKSGTPGVSWDKQKGKWRADIKVDYRQILIGRYKNYEEAVSARKVAEAVHWH